MKCPFDGKEFEQTKAGNKKFCSPYCRFEFYRAERHKMWAEKKAKRESEVKETKLNKSQLELVFEKVQNDLTKFCIFTDRNFEPYWHLKEIAGKLEQVEKGEVKRLMIFMPPRHGKSHLTTEKFPAWYLGKNPNNEVIVAAYSATLAESFGYQSRDVMKTPEYMAVFKTRLREDSKAKDHWRTIEGGGYLSVGAGGSISGLGANLLIIDDPIKNSDEAESKDFREKQWNWYISTARTRLYKNGAIILILTRWHEDDLAGRLLKQQENGGDAWEVIEYPAIAEHDEANRKEGEALCEGLMTLDELAQTKAVQGPYYWSSLYQQKPITEGDQLFKREWLTQVDQPTNTLNFLTIDTAISQRASADYSGFVINMVDSNGNWNFKAWHERLNPKQLIDLIFHLHKEYLFTKVGIEKTIYLQAIRQHITDEMYRRNVWFEVVELQHQRTAKEVRIRGLVPRYAEGKIRHIRNQCLELEEEMLKFPKGGHDDILDAAAYQLQVADTAMYEDDLEPLPLVEW